MGIDEGAFVESLLARDAECEDEADEITILRTALAEKDSEIEKLRGLFLMGDGPGMIVPISMGSAETILRKCSLLEAENTTLIRRLEAVTRALEEISEVSSCGPTMRVVVAALDREAEEAKR